jgi:tRNA 2-thiouridine synthesizing protein E
MGEKLSLADRKIELDRHGYLRSLQDWDEHVAEVLAVGEGITLHDGHWELIRLLRHFHQQSGLSPSTRVLVKLMSRELGADKGTSAYLMSLFPDTPLKLACKVAGLPRPTNCL